MARQFFEAWRRQHQATKYPFAESASLRNRAGKTLLEGMFLDAALYPVGGQAGLFLSGVVIDHAEATLYVGDTRETRRASVTFDLVSPPDELSLVDVYDRPAGVMVSESVRLAAFQSWGVGEHLFRQAESEFCAAVCLPTAEEGLAGFLLDDGSFVSGDVWLVGDDGVVVRSDDVVVGPAEDPRNVRALRVDVVGDPLFRRRLCADIGLFTTPRFVRVLRVTAADTTVDVTPDEYGDIKLTVDNDAAADTVLRITPISGGLQISVVGEPIDGGIA